MSDNNKENEDPFIDGEDLTDDEFDLLTSSSIGIRVFNLNNQSGTTLIGVVMFENEDSFLVALPSKLLKKDDDYKVDLYVPIDMVRLMKSNITLLSHPFSPFEEHYLEFLDTYGREVCPDIVDKVLGPAELEISAGSDILEEYSYPVPSDNDDDDPVGFESEAPNQVFDQQPVELDEIDEKIQEIASKGGLILGGSKTKQ